MSLEYSVLPQQLEAVVQIRQQRLIVAPHGDRVAAPEAWLTNGRLAQSANLLLFYGATGYKPRARQIFNVAFLQQRKQFFERLALDDHRVARERLQPAGRLAIADRADALIAQLPGRLDNPRAGPRHDHAYRVQQRLRKRHFRDAFVVDRLKRDKINRTVAQQRNPFVVADW